MREEDRDQALDKLREVGRARLGYLASGGELFAAWHDWLATDTGPDGDFVVRFCEAHNCVPDDLPWLEEA